MTTPDRSPCGTMWVLGSILSRNPKSSSRARSACARRTVQRHAILPQAGLSLPAVRAGNLHCRQSQPALLIEHADLRQVVTPADLEIVEVMRRRDLHRARAFFRIGIIVGDDGNAAADQRKNDMLANQMSDPFVFRMHCDRAVAEHGLRSRRGDDDESRRVLRIEGFALQG